MNRHQRVLYFTKLVGSEGVHDKTFLDLLKCYYLPKKSSLRVEIKKGHGKAQTEIVRDVVRNPGAYDKKMAVMDNDKPSSEMALADELAEANNVVVMRNTPCIEGVLIRILEPKKKLGGMSSQQLKDYFEEHYIPEKKRTDLVTYKKVFPKELLDEARKREPELDAMIKVMEGK